MNKEYILQQIKETPITFHSDAGHGWYEVKRDWLKLLEIENKISVYSYQKGDRIFLEEDCDAPLFFETLKEKFGIENKNLTFEDKYSPNSFIRNLYKYSPTVLV